MTFYANLLTLNVLGFVIILACMKTVLKLIRIWLGKDKVAGPFDFRIAPEFLGDDILFYVGGLLVLAVPTFIDGAGLPDSISAILVALQGFFLFSATLLIGWIFAKIKDMYQPPTLADVETVSVEGSLDSRKDLLATAPESAPTAPPPAPGA